jgi:L-arabonate dehydrase
MRALEIRTMSVTPLARSLHVCPEAAAGGPLGLIEDGDMIELDAQSRSLTVDLSDEELARRRASWKPVLPILNGGYQQIYVQHVLQASQGADLDFLVGCRGTSVPRESH